MQIKYFAEGNHNGMNKLLFVKYVTDKFTK
jgi:hypothetical protein